MKIGGQLRSLFGFILVQCVPSKPGFLWDRFKESICDDLCHRLGVEFGIDHPFESQIYDYGLFLLDGILKEVNKTLGDFPPMPRWERNWGGHEGNPFIAQHMSWDFEELESFVQEWSPLLNVEQVAFYHEVLESISQDQGKMFFLQGPNISGKTHLYKLLAAKLRCEGKFVICVASLGIAAQLLPRGQTTHSTFKIPINIQDGEMCTISKSAELCELFFRASLIIWDEVPMQHHNCFEAVERTMRDLRGNSRIFGGISDVFGGDFRQIFHVVVKGSREHIVGASLQRSTLCRYMLVWVLKRNMRLESDSHENKMFGEQLLEVYLFICLGYVYKFVLF